MATLVAYDPARHGDALRALWMAYAEEMAVPLREEAGLAVDPAAGVARLLAFGGTVLGCGAVRQIAPGVAEVKRMYLCPAARGRSPGRAILGELLATARGFGCRDTRLDSAWFMTDAQRLYRAAGFEECAPYPESEAPPALAARWTYMRLDLTTGASPWAAAPP